jgi:Mg2+/Co2+ transporter CorC
MKFYLDIMSGCWPKIDNSEIIFCLSDNIKFKEELEKIGFYDIEFHDFNEEFPEKKEVLFELIKNSAKRNLTSEDEEEKLIKIFNEKYEDNLLIRANITIIKNKFNN